MQVKAYPFGGRTMGWLGCRSLPIAATAAMLTIALVPACAQEAIANQETGSTLSRPAPLKAQVVVPTSSRVNPEGAGKTAHTNIRFLEPSITDPLELPPYSGYAYETPASLGCVYSLVIVSSGCEPNVTANNPSGGSESIAIVDAYDDPEAPADLAYFSAQFGIHFNPEKFQVVYAGGPEPAEDPTGGWEIEESLDIEYSHAMAPEAKLYLVEAQSNSFSDLLLAVTEATNIIQCQNFTTTVGACKKVTGRGEVSMSWGGSEFSAETTLDTYFNQTNVVFFASAGDEPGPIWPSASPNVVSVGGTTIQRSPVTGDYMAELDWPDAGSGPSDYEARPSWQTGPGVPSGTTRVTPDISSDANPYTGLWVYDSFPVSGSGSASWWIVGGTSASSPLWAGIVNRAGSFAASSTAELTMLYADLASSSKYSTDFRDITSGWCYYYQGFNVTADYDQCTGIGSPKTYSGK